MTKNKKIYDFFNGKSSSQAQEDSLKKPSESNPFSDVEWEHPEPEDRNSYEYAKYIARLLLRNGVDIEMSQRDKKKIMEYILGDSKAENVKN
jgi:hypothetical protein